MTPPLDEQGLPPGYNFRPQWEVTPRDVQKMREAGEDFVLLDCRTPDEFETARIDGAELFPLQQMPQRLDELKEDLAGKRVVIHCHHGGRSLQATLMLREVGIDDVKSMAGGIDVWAQDIDTSVKRY